MDSRSDESGDEKVPPTRGDRRIVASVAPAGPIRTGIPGTNEDFAPKPNDQGVAIAEISKSSNQTTSSAVVAHSALDPPKNVLK